MKKYLWIFIFFILIVVITIIVFNKNDNNNQEESYTAERTSINKVNKEVENIDQNNKGTTNSRKDNKEEKIASFSTRLPKDTKARYSNIELACDTLNGTIVKSGEPFSLWNVLGCPTKEKGYEKAKSFTSDGKVIKSYGGGICQVSTTIYNAVLEADDLKILERHEHSRDVSYNSADFKFKNTLDYDVKIEAEVEDNKVKIRLVKIPE